MYGALFQYQANAEPVVSGPERTSIDKWQPEVPDYRPVNKALNTALLAGSLFFVPVVQQAPTLQPLPEVQNIVPVRIPSRVHLQPQNLIAPLNLPTIWPAAFITQNIEPVRPRPKIQPFTLAFVSLVTAQPETVTLDKWFQTTQFPLRISARTTAVYQQQHFISVVIATPVVPLDRWYAPENVIFQPRKARPQYIEACSFVDIYTTSAIVSAGQIREPTSFVICGSEVKTIINKAGKKINFVIVGRGSTSAKGLT